MRPSSLSRHVPIEQEKKETRGRLESIDWIVLIYWCTGESCPSLVVKANGLQASHCFRCHFSVDTRSCKASSNDESRRISWIVSEYSFTLYFRLGFLFLTRRPHDASFRNIRVKIGNASVCTVSMAPTQSQSCSSKGMSSFSHCSVDTLGPREFAFLSSLCPNNNNLH